jgi:hypothetical protein
VVHAEVHEASEEAKAAAIAAGRSGYGARVFKRTRPDACSYCKLLYLKPDGVTPRVFRLRDLLLAGTNVGRRAGRPTRSGKSRTEWRAVVGGVHPFCQCELHVLGDDMGFDGQGNLVRVGTKKSLAIDLDGAPGRGDHRCEDHE